MYMHNYMSGTPSMHEGVYQGKQGDTLILKFGHGMAGCYKYTHCAMEHEGMYQGKQVCIGHCPLQLCIIYGQYGGYILTCTVHEIRVLICNLALHEHNQ